MQDKIYPSTTVLKLDLTPAASISPGEEILCPGLVGDFFKVTMKDGNIASNDKVMATIKYDSDYKIFTVRSLLDIARISKMEF